MQAPIKGMPGHGSDGLREPQVGCQQITFCDCMNTLSAGHLERFPLCVEDAPAVSGNSSLDVFLRRRSPPGAPRTLRGRPPAPRVLRIALRATALRAALDPGDHCGPWDQEQRAGGLGPVG